VEVSLLLGEGAAATVLKNNLPLTVLPGLPDSLQSLDSGDGGCGGPSVALAVRDGEALPALNFGVFYAWGYRTAPMAAAVPAQVAGLASKGSSKGKKKANGAALAAPALGLVAASSSEEKWDVVVELHGDGLGLGSSSGATSARAAASSSTRRGSRAGPAASRGWKCRSTCGLGSPVAPRGVHGKALVLRNLQPEPGGGKALKGGLTCVSLAQGRDQALA
jgi:hypothetical protein